MNKPEISVIVVSYNTREVLRNCLESLYDSNNKANFELIVVDNNSKDDTVGYLDEMVKKKNNLTIIKNDSNAGFAKATNQGIRAAKGKRVLLLNSDTLVFKETLKKLINFSKKFKDRAILAPQLLNDDGTVQASCFRFPTIKGAVAEFWLGKKNKFSKYAPKATSSTIVDAAVGAALLIPKKIIDKVGLLNEKYFMYFEDIDYCKRADKLGFKVVYLPSVSITHLHGESGKKTTRKTNSWLKKSSKMYHGIFKYYLLYFILLVGQKLKK